MLAAVARTAAADPGDAAANAASGEVAPYTPGGVTLRAAGELGESDAVALDAWVAINERFCLGITSSHDARRQLGAGRGLCLHACPVGRAAGAAADAEVRLSPTLVGRAALDATRFAPTAVAVELGFDAIHASGQWIAQVSPVLRLGIARRDLDNTDIAAVLAQLRLRAWSTGGVLAAARGAISLDAVRDTPSLGIAVGTWQTFAPFVLSVRGGVAEVARAHTNDTLFAEVAIGWAI